jgi:hypothetical protein
VTLADLFRERSQVELALRQAIEPVATLLRGAQGTVVSVECVNEVVELRFSDRTTSSIPLYVFETPEKALAWVEERRKVEAREFAAWKLETVRRSIDSRRRALAQAEKELAEMEASFAGSRS